MSGAGLAVLPILAVVVAKVWQQRLEAQNRSVTWRLRILFSLGCFAALFIPVGLAIRARGSVPLSLTEWMETTIALIVVGTAPLILYLAFDLPLRLDRSWELRRKA